MFQIPWINKRKNTSLKHSFVSFFVRFPLIYSSFNITKILLQFYISMKNITQRLCNTRKGGTEKTENGKAWEWKSTHGIKQVSTSRDTHVSILLGRNIILIHRQRNALTCWIYIFHRGDNAQLTIFISFFKLMQIYPNLVKR